MFEDKSWKMYRLNLWDIYTYTIQLFLGVAKTGPNSASGVALPNYINTEHPHFIIRKCVYDLTHFYRDSM